MANSALFHFISVRILPRKVRYEDLFPHEMESIMRDKPIVYLPFGTLE